MLFLESPALTASRKDWESWLSKLQKMNKRDSSVAFALKRAEGVLRRMAEREKTESKALLA